MIKIKNYRCLNSLDDTWFVWKLNPDLNLLIGPNGAGKTTIVDAIDIVLNSDGRTNRSLVSEYDFPLCNINKRIEIETTLIELGPALSLFETFIQYFDPDTMEPIDEEDRVPDDSKDLKGIILKFEAYRDPDDGEIKWQWIFPKYLPTEHENSPEISRKQHEALGYFRIRPFISEGAFTLGQYSALGRHLRKLNYKLGNLPDRIKPTYKLPECIINKCKCETCDDKDNCLNMNDDPDSVLAIGKLLQNITRHAQNMLGTGAWNDMDGSLGPRFGGLQSSLAAITLGLRNENDDLVSFIPFEKLSAGEKYALSFSLATTQIPGSQPPIILMEEPETALYPSAIGQILNRVQQTNLPQIIMTTHSESVVRRFSINHVYVMNSTKKLPERLDGSIQNSQDKRELECLIMPGKSSALFADKILIVEGAYDAIVSGELDRLATKIEGIQPSFASKNWIIYDASCASNIKSRADLLKKLGKRVCVLFDADEEGIRNANICKDLFPTFTYKSTQNTDITLELALYYGLPETDRSEIFVQIKNDQQCQSCPMNNDIKKCLKMIGGCPLGRNKEIVKSSMRILCLSKYHDNLSFPNAFSNLLSIIDTTKEGAISELEVDYVANGK